MNVIVLHYGMGKSGSRLIELIQERHSREETVETARLEPIKERGFYGWFVRSLVPGLKAPVKPVNLGAYKVAYLLAPKWGYNCPPINAFVDANDFKRLSLILIITYTKGDISGYRRRLERRVRERGANLLGVLALKREEILSGQFTEKMNRFWDGLSLTFEGFNSEPCGEHDIVFIGMVNVNRDGYLQGVVDVWRCRSCRKLFCEDRRYGEALEPRVGFEEILDDEQWAILTCTDVKGVTMRSVAVKPGKKMAHICRDGEQREFVVSHDWNIQTDDAKAVHRLFLVKDHLNRNIEGGYYRLKMLRDG